MKRFFVLLTVLTVLGLGSSAVLAVEVYDIVALPNVLETYTYFTAQTLPAQYLLDLIEVKVYNLYGQLLYSDAKEDVYRIGWDGDSFANGIYLYTCRRTW